MLELLPPWPLFGAFLLASLILAITPGPGVFYIVTRSVTQGRRLGLASVAGVAAGNFGNALGASLGLAALFAVSSLAFMVVKYIGAGYLIYLGIKALRAPATPFASDTSVAAATWQHVCRDGFMVALLNPKTTIFFAAFLPQFIATPHAFLPTVLLGALFVLIAATTDSLYALGAGSLRPYLTKTARLGVWGKYCSGGAYIGLGLLTALASNRTK